MAFEVRQYRDPFQVMQERMQQALQQMITQGGQRGQRQGEGDAIVPAADAIDDENAYLLSLEIPGVDPRDVDVSVVGNTLTIKAERRRHGQQDGQEGQSQGQQGQQGQQRARHHLFSEIQYGVIRREFGLPEDADRNRITADFRNGLLNLSIPKSQEVHQRRKIEIKSS